MIWRRADTFSATQLLSSVKLWLLIQLFIIYLKLSKHPKWKNILSFSIQNTRNIVKIFVKTFIYFQNGRHQFSQFWVKFETQFLTFLHHLENLSKWFSFQIEVPKYITRLWKYLKAVDLFRFWTIFNSMWRNVKFNLTKFSHFCPFWWFFKGSIVLLWQNHVRNSLIQSYKTQNVNINLIKIWAL